MSTETAARRAPAPIEPRLRDRRVSVKREQGRRRLRRIGYVAGVLAVVVLIVVLLASPLFAISRVTIRGATNTGAGDVRSAAQLSGCAIAWCDTDAAVRRIQRLPWVARARVDTSWPNRARVTVTERVATAYITVSPDRRALVDGDGRVLDVLTPAPDGPRVELRGIGTVGAPGEFLDERGPARVAAALDGPIRDRAVAVDAASMAVVLDDGTEVRLGDDSDVAVKLAAANAVLQQLDTTTTYIDVRVPSAPAVGPARTKK